MDAVVASPGPMIMELMEPILTCPRPHGRSWKPCLQSSGGTPGRLKPLLQSRDENRVRLLAGPAQGPLPVTKIQHLPPHRHHAELQCDLPGVGSVDAEFQRQLSRILTFGAVRVTEKTEQARDVYASAVDEDLLP